MDSEDSSEYAIKQEIEAFLNAPMDIDNSQFEMAVKAEFFNGGDSKMAAVKQECGIQESASKIGVCQEESPGLGPTSGCIKEEVLDVHPTGGCLEEAELQSADSRECSTPICIDGDVIAGTFGQETSEYAIKQEIEAFLNAPMDIDNSQFEMAVKAEFFNGGDSKMAAVKQECGIQESAPLCNSWSKIGVCQEESPGLGSTSGCIKEEVLNVHPTGGCSEEAELQSADSRECSTPICIDGDVIAGIFGQETSEYAIKQEIEAFLNAPMDIDNSQFEMAVKAEFFNGGDSKEPFQHDSLLVDRKDKKLSQAEKRRSYELEKQQASINSRTVYGYSGAGNQQGLQIRGEGGGVVNEQMADEVRPMQSELSSQLVRGGDGASRPRSWIPAEVWQKRGMSAQEMTLPLDVVIPTNSPDRSSIVLKAGQKVMVLQSPVLKAGEKVMVLQSPKHIYLQLENGKIIAIRTAIKGNKGEKKTDNKREFTFEGKKEIAVQPNRERVQNLPIMRNNISIIPRGGGATGIQMAPGNRPLAHMLGQNSNRPWGTPKQPIATTKPYFGETPPVTDKILDENTGETTTDDLRSKDKQPQRSASASSGASEASRQDSSSVEMSGSGSAAHKRKGSSEQDHLKSTEEELLHDMDDEDYDDEDDDDDDDADDDEELYNYYLHHPHHASHRMRASPMMSSHSHGWQTHQRHGLTTNQQAATKKSTFSSSGNAGQSMCSSSPSVPISVASSSSSGSHTHQTSTGSKMISNTGGGQQQSSSHSTTSNIGSHTTTSIVGSHSTASSTGSNVTTSTAPSSAPSAAVGTAPAEKESQHPQMMSHHHQQQQMSHHVSQQPVSNPTTSRTDDREYNIHGRYTPSSSSTAMTKGGTDSSHIPTSSHPPLPKHLSSSVTVSPVASSASSISVPMNSPSMSSISNTPQPSSAVSINPVNTPSVGFNPSHPAVSMTPVSVNPPPTYSHTPGQTSTAGSTGCQYTSTEYTADALTKSSEPTSSYHPALSHLKTISDHSISIFPVDSAKSAAAPSITITSAQYGSDYYYRQDFQSSRQAPASRDYYQGFSQPPIGGYPSSSSSAGYYPSSTVTSSGVQRKEGKDSVAPYSSSGSYDGSSSYLPPNPFTATAVGPGYSSRSSSYPQTTPSPSHSQLPVILLQAQQHLLLQHQTSPECTVLSIIQNLPVSSHPHVLEWPNLLHPLPINSLPLPPTITTPIQCSLTPILPTIYLPLALNLHLNNP